MLTCWLDEQPSEYHSEDVPVGQEGKTEHGLV